MHQLKYDNNQSTVFVRHGKLRPIFTLQDKGKASKSRMIQLHGFGFF